MLKFEPAPQTQRNADLKTDLLNAAQRVKDSQSKEQLEDALRSVEYFFSLLRNNPVVSEVLDSHNWPIGGSLICIVNPPYPCTGLHLNECYKLIENCKDSYLVIVEYKGERRYQHRNNFKLA